MNKQPFYHHVAVLFTATDDVTDRINSSDFKAKLAGFLKRNLGPVLTDSVELDGPATAEPGDPADLVY
jgi:hypothetical protein